MVTKKSGRSAPAKKAASKIKAPAAQTKAAMAVAMPSPDLDAETPADGDLCGLSIRAARFVDIFLHSFNASQAYVEAGYSAKNSNVARTCAAQLLARPSARAYLSKRAAAMFDRLEQQQDTVLRTLWLTALADPNELVSFVRGACRYCYGTGHRYQFTAGEWARKVEKHEEARERHVDAGKPDPGPLSQEGGLGYDRRKDPHPDCPECFGDGDGRLLVKDTTRLSPAGQALYAGVRESKDGIEVVMNSQQKALEMLAKILKLADESPKVHMTLNYAELEAKYGETMRRAQERAAQIRRERFGERGLGMMPGDRGCEVVGPEGKLALEGRQ
jgi:phage terminase small subunit